MDRQTYERIEAWPDSGNVRLGNGDSYRERSNNQQFKSTFLTWVNLGILLVGYPVLSLLGGGPDSANLLKQIGANQTLLMFVLITTIILQWFIFAVNYGGVFTEGTGLKGLGLTGIKPIHLAWAVAFLLASNLILAGLAWLLAQIGLPMPGEIGLMVPTTLPGKIVWVAVSFTAGFCEEIAFRGYLMTRLRLLLKCKTWIIPTAISAVTFGVCHAYQGWPGLIVISAYGLLFSLLYIRTGSLWPCIIAHFFQDFMALFIPQ